jgi:hypothetical protein
MWTCRHFLRQTRTRPIRRPTRPLIVGEEVAETAAAIRDAVSSGDAGGAAWGATDMATRPVGTGVGAMSRMLDASKDLAAPSL